MPFAVSEESMSWLERFVVLMYDNTSDITEINEARKQLFAHKGRTLQTSLPPRQLSSSTSSVPASASRPAPGASH